jgi:hypothetical protein
VQEEKIADQQKRERIVMMRRSAGCCCSGLCVCMCVVMAAASTAAGRMHGGWLVGWLVDSTRIHTHTDKTANQFLGRFVLARRQPKGCAAASIVLKKGKRATLVLVFGVAAIGA